ncbi:hypothetical protein HYU06_05875 [Candidatus Woesearchaeota archaeon]|nr:hypothetical protein [Candidatus Woesearchaeota archaeon]
MVTTYPQLKTNYADGDILYSGTDLAAQSGLNAINTALMNAPTLIHAGRGTTTSATEVELDTKTVAANDFAVGDKIIVEVHAYDTNVDPGITAAYLSCRINDGTNTFTLNSSGSSNTKKIWYLRYSFTNPSNYATTLLISSLISYVNTSTGNEDIKTMIANWITSAFTISLRGRTSTGSDTLYFNWKVYRLRGS